MKLYKKLKGMKKSFAIGLAGGILYASTSIAGSVDTSVEKKEQIVEPVSIEQVITIEQAETLYKSKLEEYAKDKKIKFDETKSLYEIIDKGRALELEIEAEHKISLDKQDSVLRSQLEVLKFEKSDLLEPLNKLNGTIVEKKQELTFLEERIQKQVKYQKIFDMYETDLKNIKKGLDDLLLDNYPGLLKEDNLEYNVTYTAEIGLSQDFYNLVTPLLEKTHEIFEVVYQNDDIANFLLKKLTLQDILVFRKIINTPQQINYNPKDYVSLKTEKLRLTKQLEQEKSALAEKLVPKIKVIEGKMDVLNGKLSDITEQRSVDSFFEQRESHFKNYMSALNERKEFLEDHWDASKFWISSLTLEEWGLKGVRLDNSRYDYTYEPIDLEKLLKKDGFDVDVEDIPNPTSPKFPTGIAWVAGIGITLLRRWLVPRYVIKREYDVMDFADILFIPTALGALFLDGLHPLVYPFRLFGWPFVEEPIRKVFGWSKPRE